MPVERHQRPDRDVHRAQFRSPAEIGQIYDEAGRDHVGADLAQQFYRTLGGTPGRDQIVDQDDALAGMYGVGVHLHFIEAVFQRIGDPHGGVRQFSLFPDRHEADT
jgi:hypothetical protein